MLAALAPALLLASCGHGSPAPASSASAAARPASAAPATMSSAPLRVRSVGSTAALLRRPRTVTFAFSFVGEAPTIWNWRVVGVYGGVVASGVETTTGSTLRVDWDCTRPDGGQADPGEYVIRVGRGRASPVNDTVKIAWIRFQPPVEAHIYRRLPAAGRKVALTFDDGGGNTAWYWILRELRDAHAKATFFPCGVYVGDYAKREAFLTIKDHMAVGNHTWSHQDLVAASDAEARSQIIRNEQAWWRDLRASTVPYLRPPGGDYDARVLALAGELGYSRVVLWDVESADVSNPGVDAIVHNVLDHVRNGSIILMHTRGQTPNALPRIIAGLQARHYQMVTLPALFQAAGVK
jgi:peptidoglycan-N-acetylglucosamine deacetylase